jgi:hypothetical protein
MKENKLYGVAAAAAEDGEVLGEEIEFFRGFGYKDKWIAERLGVKLATLQTRDRRKRQKE